MIFTMCTSLLPAKAKALEEEECSSRQKTHHNQLLGFLWWCTRKKEIVLLLLKSTPFVGMVLLDETQESDEDIYIYFFEFF